jgi:hypothetical protein
MSKLNRDILYLIFEELQDDNMALYSSLSVNKTWCEIIIPILWNNPRKYLTDMNGNLNSLFNVIISHLSDESKNNLKKIHHNLIISYQKPLFNYISFCKHLDLGMIEEIIYWEFDPNKMTMATNEIFKLFVNENIKYTHLYIPQHFNYPIHLISGAKYCFSEIVFLSCHYRINSDVLIKLVEICQPIKELELLIEVRSNS